MTQICAILDRLIWHNICFYEIQGHVWLQMHLEEYYIHNPYPCTTTIPLDWNDNQSKDLNAIFGPSSHLNQVLKFLARFVSLDVTRPWSLDFLQSPIIDVPMKSFGLQKASTWFPKATIPLSSGLPLVVVKWC